MSSSGEWALWVSMYSWVVWGPIYQTPWPCPPERVDKWCGHLKRQNSRAWGGPRNRVNGCHASMAILRLRIYVTGTQSLNSQGQGGIWVNRKLKMELK